MRTASVIARYLAGSDLRFVFGLNGFSETSFPFPRRRASLDSLSVPFMPRTTCG